MYSLHEELIDCWDRTYLRVIMYNNSDSVFSLSVQCLWLSGQIDRVDTMHHIMCGVTYYSILIKSKTSNKVTSLVPQGGLVGEECPLGLNAFLSTRPPMGLKNIRYFCIIWPIQGSDHLVIPNNSDGKLHEIMIKSRGHSMHTGHGIEPTVYLVYLYLSW